MGYINGFDRDQIIRFPEVIDDYGDAATPVRFLEVFVDSLDLKTLGLTQATPTKTGRPASHPRDMLTLYLYGYWNKLRSRRKLEHETQRNLALMWWWRKRTPDCKTSADFRQDNPQALQHVGRELTMLGKKLDLFGRALMAMDGRKCKAVNSQARHVSANKLPQLRQHSNAKSETYLKDLDKQDVVATPMTKESAQTLKEKIDQWRAHTEPHEEWREKRRDRAATHMSLTDPASRSRKTKQGTDVCYHVHIAVDQPHTLLVDHAVTQDVTDLDQLATLATRAKDTREAERVDAVADRGAYNGEEGKKCFEDGMTPYIAKPHTSAKSQWGLCGQEDFLSDAAQDGSHCPAGHALVFRCATIAPGRQSRDSSTSACTTCPLKSPCTRNTAHRRMTRWVHEAMLEEMPHRVTTHPEKSKARQRLVEHPCGTMKRGRDQGYCLPRGLVKVRGERSGTMLAYNFKRVRHIMGIEALIDAVA